MALTMWLSARFLSGATFTRPRCSFPSFSAFLKHHSSLFAAWLIELLLAESDNPLYGIQYYRVFFPKIPTKIRRRLVDRMNWLWIHAVERVNICLQLRDMPLVCNQKDVDVLGAPLFPEH